MIIGGSVGDRSRQMHDTCGTIPNRGGSLQVHLCAFMCERLIVAVVHVTFVHMVPSWGAHGASRFLLPRGLADTDRSAPPQTKGCGSKLFCIGRSMRQFFFAISKRLFDTFPTDNYFVIALDPTCDNL